MPRMWPKVIPQAWVWLQSPHSLHHTFCNRKKKITIPNPCPSTNSPVPGPSLYSCLPVTPPEWLGVSSRSSGIVWRLGNVWVILAPKNCQPCKRKNKILQVADRGLVLCSARLCAFNECPSGRQWGWLKPSNKCSGSRKPMPHPWLGVPGRRE